MDLHWEISTMTWEEHRVSEKFLSLPVDHEIITCFYLVIVQFKLKCFGIRIHTLGISALFVGVKENQDVIFCDDIESMQ